MTINSANQIISTLIGLLNEKSMTNLDNFVNKDIEYWDPSIGTINGIIAINEKIANFWIKHPKCIITIDVIVGNEDIVVAELSYPGFKTEKQSSIIFSTIVCNLKNSRITKIKNYYDPQI